MKLRKVSHDIEKELKNPAFAKVYNEELIRLELAHKLAQTREKAHLSQTVVAKRMGVSPQLVSRIETGNLNLTVGTIFRYAKSIGSELIFSLCEQFGTGVVVINASSESTFEDDLVQDVLEIITVFSARLYGSRSRKNKQLLMSHVERTLFAALASGVKACDCKSLYQKRFGITARQFNSCRVTVEGVIESVKERRKGQISESKSRIEELKKAIQKLEKKKRHQKSIHQKKRRLASLTNKYIKLEKDHADGKIRLCFGSKKLFYAQFALEKKWLHVPPRMEKSVAKRKA